MTDEYLVTALNDLADMYGAEVVLAEARRLLGAATPAPPPIEAIPDHGKVGWSHPQTSVTAAVTAKVKNQRVRLLELITAAGREGLTCREAADKLGMSPNQVATRMMELRENGNVVRLEERRVTTPGNTGHVHVLTEYAEPI